LKVLLKYPNLFVKTEINYKEFLWCHGYVITRCFGFPDNKVYLISFADFLNHSPRGQLNTYMVQLDYEKNAASKPDIYNIKSEVIDFSIFGDQ